MPDISNFCRLCCSEITYGSDIFVTNNEQTSLSALINKYLPIKVIEDNLLPRKICETCHISVAGTIDFIDLLAEGQLRLKSHLKLAKIHKKGQNDFGKQSNFTNSSHISGKENLETEIGLDSVSSSNLFVDIQGELPNIVMNDFSKGLSAESVYECRPICDSISNLHPRKGRPRKPKRKIVNCDLNQQRPKRTTCTPSRYKDSLAGRDFEDLLAEKNDSSTLERLEDGTAQLKTMFDGSTVIITQNDHDEHFRLPDEVNIELDFKKDCISNLKNGAESDTPIASVSSVQIVIPPKMSANKPAQGYSRKNTYRKWFCDTCNKRFKYKGRYLIHLSTHEHFTYQCEECKERFNLKQQLMAHQDSLNHQGIGVIEENKEVKCNICENLVFQTNEALKKHQSEFHNITKKKISASTSLFKTKRANRTSESTTTHCCEVCGKIFLRKACLLLHRDRAHSDNPHFVCSICGKNFAHRQLLHKHRAVAHSDERPYDCDVCSLKFKTKVGLVSHKATHSKSKRYTCEICGKVLNHLTSLSHHLQSHQGEKPHACPHCGKAFTQKGNLLEHIRTHTGEKPFTCAVCSKAFKTSSQVKHHTKMHFRPSYKCHVCEKTFIKEDSLTKHLDTHLDIKEPEATVVPVPSIAAVPTISSDPNVVPIRILDDCLNSVHLPLVDNLLLPEVLPDMSKQLDLSTSTNGFAMPTNLSFDANGPDSSVIYIISKKDYQHLQFNNIEDEVFVENAIDNAADAFNLY